MRENLFISNNLRTPERTAKKHPLKLESGQYLENLTPGRKSKRLFYQKYFSQTALLQGIPIDNFYDPLKQTPVNTRFKSFTNQYFRLIMKSEKFETKVKELMQKSSLIVHVLSKYPKMMDDLILANPTILLDQQKTKSKFIWTSYEFYFAMFFFRVKFGL